MNQKKEEILSCCQGKRLPEKLPTQKEQHPMFIYKFEVRNSAVSLWTVVLLRCSYFDSTTKSPFYFRAFVFKSVNFGIYYLHNPNADSIVPIILCLLIERGLSLNIIREGAGMFAHIVNIIVLVLIPMVIIHVNGNAFSLSE